jgi:hypothetical protein
MACSDEEVVHKAIGEDYQKHVKPRKRFLAKKPMALPLNVF